MTTFCRLICAILLLGWLQPATADENDSTEGPVEPQISLEDIRTLADVFGYIQDHYVDEVDDRDLLDAAIRGMLSELDPHSKWLSADEMQELEDQASGRYGGLGVEILVRDTYLEVVSAMDQTPAARAGLLPGDRITQIDDNRIRPENADEAMEWLRGEPGSSVELAVEREGREDPLEMSLEREIIRVPSISSRIFEDRYAYVRLATFQHESAPALESALDEFLARDNPPEGLILDLRRNPGGVLSAAVGVAESLLANDELIVYTRGQDADSERRYYSRNPDVSGDLPLIVLVDRGSASGSEIVAGALQANQRALVLGERTFGKGSVQTVVPLRNGSGMRVTTSLYYTPDDRSIESAGIWPDVRVDRNGEAHHPLPENDDDGPDSLEALRDSDPALYEAIGLLRNARVLTRSS